MKTKLFTFLKRAANTPPMLLIVLFVLFSPVQSWADPIAIGTGTVTLNYANTSDPVAPASNTYSNAAIGSGETCIAFGNTAWDGSIVYSKAEWSVTIVPGVYDVAVTYGTGSWGTTPLFSLYNGESKVTDIFQAPGGRTSGAWATAAGWDGSVSNLDLSDLNGSTTYTIRVTETWGGAYGTCIGHISFTLKEASISSKADPELALTTSEKTIPVGGAFDLGVTAAEGYDGEISYSISPSGIISRDGTNITGTTIGEATVTVTASATEAYDGASRTCKVYVVKNFAGDLAAVENDGTVSLNWFYNLPISLATEGDGVSNDWSNNGYHSSSYEAGVRTIRYYRNGDRGYACNDFKTPSVENCISFSFDYKGNNDNGTNPRIVPYSWVSGCDASLNYGDIVAAPVSITSEWQTATVTPAYYYAADNINVQGSSMPFNYKDHPVGCVAFFPMADNSVADGTIQLRNAYFQLSNTNGLTTSVALVRKDGSAPANASDGAVRYTGAPTTFADNSGLVAGHTYYYRVFATYNGYTYASAPVSVIMPGAAKEDPELSLSESSAFMAIGDTYTLTPNKANEYDGIITYEITSGSAYVSLEGNVITATSAGTATITVTAPETENYSEVSQTFNVTVVALPETNLALDASGANIELSWNIPGVIDLTTARTSSITSSNYTSDFSQVGSWSMNGEALNVTYTCSQWAMCGIAFPIELDNVERLSFECKTGDTFDGGDPGSLILAAHAGQGNVYYSGGLGLPKTSWTPFSSTFTKKWYNASYSNADLDNVDEVCVFINPNPGQTNSVFSIRNLRYHCTGMTDIDHIVIMRTTGAAATDTTSGTKLYSGRMFHYIDNSSLSSGMYYYTIFAVYEDACFPVEYVTLDNRSFSITYKDKGDAEFSGTHETGYPTTHSNAAATELKKATKEDYVFVGWYDNAACTGDAVTSLAAGAYDADITLYARWEQLSLHQPGKYQAPTSEDGYGRVLKNINGHDYEVYMVTYDEAGRECTSGCDNKNGELYAGPTDSIHHGYRLFTGSGDTEAKSADGWVAFKPYKYYGDAASCNVGEFQKLNANSSIASSRYARIGEGYYVRMYVQGYDQFAFVGQDNSAENHFVIRIDGVQQEYTPNSSDTHVARYDLTTNEPHFIEITGSTNNTNSKFRGFSLRLPDVERYTVTVAKNDNSYGTVSAASIANVRAGEATYVTDNTLYIAGHTVTATPAENTAEYTYAFDNWSGVPATITEATTVTANFTRTGNDYTLTWDLNGGTVTTAGTGAEMDATGTPSSLVAYGTAITAPIVAKDGYAFIGWDVTPSTMPAENITYTAQWAEYHQPGKYVTPEGEDGYGQDLKFNNHRYYEVYRFAKFDEKGALYAGSESTVTNGFAIISNAENNTESKDNDGWVVVKPYDYVSSGGTYNIGAEFMTINNYARFDSNKYLRLYVQGYDEFAFAARDNGTSEQLVVRINGVVQSYDQNTSDHISNRYDLDENTPYVIEITSNSTGHNCRILGFSLRIPGVEQYTVTMASSNNSYGTVDVASISPVPSGSTVSIADNVLTLNETNVTATPTTATAEYTYAFNGWSVSNGASITEDQTITANFTRTTNSYTLTWNLDGGTVTEAGTGADVNATGTPSSSVAYGTAITVPTVTKAGSDFLGWDVTPAATMPAEDVTYTAKWYAPVVIPSGTTHLDANNYYPYTTAAKAPTKSTFNVDGEGAAETCLDISDNHYAEWQAKIAQGYYQATMLYGTTGYAVNVNLKVIDPSTNPETIICTTTTDIHSDGSGNHCCYQAKWGVDLRGIDDDPDKLYIIRVEDVYDGTGSHPQIGYVEFEPATPTTLSGTAPTYMDHNNVTTAYRITPFDIDNNGQNEMCVFVGNQNQAEWLIKINPATYKVRVRYGKASGGVKLNLYLINADGVPVWTSDQRSLSDGTRYETWEINGLNLLDGYSSSEEYLLRIKDTYGSDGSTPNIEYIEFIPQMIHTRSNLRAGDFGTVCLPYAIAAADINGAEIYKLVEWPVNASAVTLELVENMEAGHPYIYQATANTATWRYYPEGDPTDATSENGLIGSYVRKLITPNDNNYIIYNNKLYYVDSNAYVGVNKAYINRTEAENAPAPGAPAPGRKRIQMAINGAQTATGLEGTQWDSNLQKVLINGQLFIIRDGKTYNAQGKLVK